MIKIPRSEMIIHEKLLKDIFGKDITYIVGSYRRGNLLSGDIDCIIKS